MSYFDNIQKTVFQIASNVFGDNCFWLPLSGGAELNASVLYQEPSSKRSIDRNDYEIEDYSIEYNISDLPGLYDSVLRRNNEQIRIVKKDGTEIKFWVDHAKKIFDGRTIKAFLKPV